MEVFSTMRCDIATPKQTRCYLVVSISAPSFVVFRLEVTFHSSLQATQAQSLSFQALITSDASSVCGSQAQPDKEQLSAGVTSLCELEFWLHGKDFREDSEDPSPITVIRLND